MPTQSDQADKLYAHAEHPWLNDQVIYQMYLRAFTPEGTLQAAISKLAEVAAVGVDIVYLCPICAHDDDSRQEFWSPRQKASGCNNPKNPYRIKDFFAVDPEYGTDDDLRAFVAEAHRLGLKVMLDIVFLHCGPTAVFLDEHPDFVDRDENGAIKPGPWNFPMLNFANQELRDYLWENLEYWPKTFGVDGYRCDVSGDIPLDFWVEARRRVAAIDPEFVWLGESWRKEEQLEAFDLNYSFAQDNALYALMKGERTAIDFRHTWEALAAEWPVGARFIRYTDNHDLANDNRARIEGSWGPEAVRATHVLMFALDGVPMLYNGQEIADAEPHSIYANWPIDWSKATTPKAQQRLALCRKLCALQHTYPELSRGDLTWLDHDRPEQVLAFVRSFEGRRLLAIFNLSKEPVDVTIPYGAELVILVADGVALSSDAGKLTAQCQPFAYCIGR